MFIFIQIIFSLLLQPRFETVITYIYPNNVVDLVPVNIETNKQEFKYNIPILVYHNIEKKPLKVSNLELPYYVTPEVLEEQFKYLSDNNYTSITFKDIQLIEENKLELPEKPVIITFDDGRANQFTSAYPLLKKYNLKAVFYVFTNAIDRPGYFTWDQLKELSNSGMEIGDHTRFHWYLTKQTDEVLEKEIINTKKLLEDNLNIKVLSLAYPFGLYNDKVIEFVKRADFKYARSLKHTIEISDSNRFILGSFITQNSLYSLKKILGTMY